MEPIITVLSSFANDTYINNRINKTYTKSGGPALFIKNVFEQENLPYTLITGETMEVEILISEKDENGRIERNSIRQEVPAIKTKALCISTILDEWPMYIKKFEGILFLEIQGFVRDGRFFGKKKKIEINDDFKPFCIKGTSNELAYLPTDFISDQKTRCLIMTMGRDGSEIFLNGNRHLFKAKNIITTSDTVGAGDTFFAHFIASYLKTSNVVISGNIATQKTEEFLSRKNLQQN